MVKSLGDIIRARIAADGRGVRELSRACGVAPAVLSRFIRNQRDLRLDSADALCRELGLRLVTTDKVKKATVQ